MDNILYGALGVTVGIFGIGIIAAMIAPLELLSAVGSVLDALDL